MATYIEKSLVSTSKLSHITTSTMETIRNIDATVSKISLSLDDELSKMNDDNVCKIKALLRAIKVLDNRRVQLATHNYDLVDKHVQITDYNIKDMENVMKLHNTSVENSDSFETASHRNGPVVSTTEKNLESGSDPLSFHKNEPVYCTCKQIAFGDMIACEDEMCTIEWYHYKCVGLKKAPRNKWICGACTKRNATARPSMGKT